MNDRPDIPKIAEGVFFTSPGKLPRGPHKLSRDEVSVVHREQLMIALTELLAAHGYAAFGVKEIVEHAGVSRTAFYNCFDSKETCAEAAYSRFITVLVDRIMGQLVQRSSDDVFSVLAQYFSALQSDLVVAKAFQVEMDAAGKQARIRRRDALRGIAYLLHAEQQRQALDDPSLDPDISIEAFVGAVYAVRQLASDILETDPEPDLESVVPQVIRWLDNSIRRRTESKSD